MERTTSIFKILLVEDNPADILLFEEMLESVSDTQYKIFKAQKISESIKVLENKDIDAILLNLGLPDANGVQTVREMRQVTTQIPIIVVTHIEDEEVAFQCIQEGVQDYLIKGRIDSVSLHLTIGYSILRQRNAEIEEYKTIAKNNFSLSREAQGYRLINKKDPIRLLKADYFEEIVEKYSFLLFSYVMGSGKKNKKTIAEMEEFISDLGQDQVRSEDLLDIHIAALENNLKTPNTEITQKLRKDGQFFALEMMGFLANYYRKLKIDTPKTQLN